MPRRARGAPLSAQPRLLLLLAGLPFLLVSSLFVTAAQPQTTPGSFELLGSYVTPASTAVTPWKSLTLVGTTRGLLVQDLRNPAAMTTVADLPLGAAMSSIATWGDSALVTLADDSRRLIDLSVPAVPREVPLAQWFELPNLGMAGQQYRVWVEADSLRVARLTSTGYVVTGTVRVAGDLVSLAVEDTTAYVIMHEAPPHGWGYGLYLPLTVVSLGDPASPTILKRIEPGSYEHLKVCARDGILCLVVRDRRYRNCFLVCLDLRDPANPVFSNFVIAGQVEEPLGLCLAVDRALVWGWYGPERTAIRIVDISNPAQIRPYADYLSEGWRATALAFQQNLMLAVAPGALRVLEASGLATVTDWGTSYGYLAQAPAVAGDGAFYVAPAVYPPCLLVFDASDPAHLAPPDSMRLTARTVKGTVSSMEAFRGAIYMNTQGGVGLLDASQPLAPSEAGFWSGGGGILRVSEQACRIAQRRSDSAVSVFDVSDPFHPRLEGSAPPGGACTYCQLSDDAVFVQHARPDDGYYTDLGDTIVALALSGPNAFREASRLLDEHSMVRNFVLRGRYLITRSVSFENGSTEPWHYVDIAYDVGDPANMEKAYEGDLPKMWSTGGRAYSALGRHLQLTGDHLAAYDMSQTYLEPPLIAETTLPVSGALLTAAGDLVYAFTPGRLDVLRFRPDVMPPQLTLAVAADAAAPATLRVRLTADEPLDAATVAVAAGDAALPVAEESAASFLAAIPAELDGRLTVTAQAADPAGNAAQTSFTFVAGTATAAGGGLRDPVTGLALAVPAGAFPGPVRLALVMDEGAAGGDSLAFFIEPSALRPACALELSMPAPAGTVPRLLGWTGTGYSDYVVRLDRASARGTARIDRLGRFLLLPDADQPPVARTALEPAAPNPFNARTNLAFALAAEGRATLRMFDARGRLVRTLQDGTLPAGRHGFDWDGRDDGGRVLPSGLYFYRLSAGGERLTGRCALVK